MEQSQLKKGLAKQFIFQSDRFVHQTLDIFFSKLKTYNYSNRSWNKILHYFETCKKFAIHKSEFGSNKNPMLGITFLLASRFNEEKEWEEDNLCSASVYFSKNPFNFDFDEMTNFEVSMHVFERIFERHPNKKMKDFNIAYEVINEELKYITVFSYVLKLYFNFLSLEEKKLFENNNYFIIPIPTKDGIFICHLHQNSLCVRTFLSTNEMTLEQKEKKEIFLNFIKPYVSCHLTYLHKIINDDKSNIYQNIEAALLFCSILMDMKPFIKKILSSCFNESVSEKCKKQWSNLILNRIDKFIKKNEPYTDSTIERNSEIRNAGENGTMNTYFKNFKIRLASQK